MYVLITDRFGNQTACVKMTWTVHEM